MPARKVRYVRPERGQEGRENFVHVRTTRRRGGAAKARRPLSVSRRSRKRSGKKLLSATADWAAARAQDWIDTLPRTRVLVGR